MHGTTRRRAEEILRVGPNPRYQEPDGHPSHDGLSTTLVLGPFLLGTAEDYARAKARVFPDEGGPAILEVDVPDEIVREAVNDWFPLDQGFVQFDLGAGLERLISTWPSLVKEIRPLS